MIYREQRDPSERAGANGWVMSIIGRPESHNQLKKHLAVSLQFEVNYLNGNLIALSFAFTYLLLAGSSVS